jgi:hypothetical protein
MRQRQSFKHLSNHRFLGIEQLEGRILLSVDAPYFYVDITVTHYENSGLTVLKREWESIRSIKETSSFQIDEAHEHVSEYYDWTNQYVGKPEGQSSYVFRGDWSDQGRTLTFSLDYNLLQAFGAADVSRAFWGSRTSFEISGKVYARVGRNVRIDNVINYTYEKTAETNGANLYVSLAGARLGPSQWGPQNTDNTFASYYNTSSFEETLIDGIRYRYISNLWFSSTIIATDVAPTPHWYRGVVSYSGLSKFVIDDLKPVPVAQFSPEIGLGKTVTLQGSDSYDPDNMDGRQGIQRYEWFSRKRGSSKEELIGLGQPIEYRPKEHGIYDILLIVTDDEGNQVAKEYQLKVNLLFINVIEHGWAPLESQLPETQQKFANYAKVLRDHALPYLATPSVTGFYTDSIPWDSRSGFTEAIGYRLLYEALNLVPLSVPLRLVPIPARLFLKLKLGAWTIFRQSHDRAQLEADRAAWLVASHVDRKVSEMRYDITQSYAVNLIGHSRGGYVVSQASRYLLEKYGINTCAVTTLDGFGSDWPALAGSIADGDIANTAVADKRNNYRVQDSLLQINGSTDYLSNIIVFFLNTELQSIGIPYRVDSSSIRPLLDWIIESQFNWKAPLRPFDSNEVVLDPAGTQRSNHINVHELYFQKNQPLLNESPYVKHQCCTSLFNNDGMGESEGRSSSNPSSSFQPLSQSSLKSMRTMQKTAQDSGPVLKDVLSDFDSWLDALILLAGSPGWLESSLFEGTNVLLADVNNDTGLGFSAVGSVKLPMKFKAGRNWLTLRLDRNSIAEDSALSIKIGDTTLVNWNSDFLLGQSDVIRLPVDSTQEIDYVTINGNKLTLMHLDIADSEEAYGLTVEKPVLATGESLQLKVEKYFAQSISNRRLGIYYESNGQEGLQLGDGGDALIASEEWNEGSLMELTIDSLPNRKDTGRAYAVVTNNGQNFYTNSVDIAFANEDNRWLTNRFNKYDANRDSFVNPIDVLVIIDRLNRFGATSIENFDTNAELVDVNEDGHVNPLDVLNVIDYLNRMSGGSSSGEGEVGFHDEALPSANYDAVSSLLNDLSCLPYNDLDIGYFNAKLRRRRH